MFDGYSVRTSVCLIKDQSLNSIHNRVLVVSCLGRQALHLEEVSTVRGSGWVNDQQTRLLLILEPES